MAKLRFKGNSSGSGIPAIQDNLDNAQTIQTFIKSQIYMKGYQFGVNPGANPNLPIVLTGTARRLFGFVLYVTSQYVTDDDTFSLTINNEIIVETTIWRAFYPANLGNFKQQMFFATPRPLSGSDSINMSWTANTQKNIFPVFYLSNSGS